MADCYYFSGKSLWMVANVEEENLVFPEESTGTETIVTETVVGDDPLLTELKTTNEFLHYNLAIQSFIIAILIVIVFFVGKGSGNHA